MRVATLDIGTNTVLMLVAERGEDGELRAVEEHATITRLGEGVDRTRVLGEAAIARTKHCLDEYAAILGRLQVRDVVVVGTSAMRDAGGGEILRDHVRARFGVDARVISGDEEARLTFSGALSGLDFARESGEVAVFDIGGGSTEIVRGTLPAAGEAETDIAYAHSFDVGSVRMTERHVRSDPPSAAELAAVTHDALSLLAPLAPLRPGQIPVGIAGTVTTLAAVSLGMVKYDGARLHGHRMTTAELQRVVKELAAMPLARRRQVPGLEPKRADVVVGGGLVAMAVLQQLGADSFVVSDRGVRWGLAVAFRKSSATM